MKPEEAYAQIMDYIKSKQFKEGYELYQTNSKNLEIKQIGEIVKNLAKVQNIVGTSEGYNMSNKFVPKDARQTLEGLAVSLFSIGECKDMHYTELKY